MKTITFSTAGQISEPVHVSAGSRVTLSGLGSLQYADGTLQSAKDDRVTWAAWPKGSTPGFCDVLRSCVMRAVSTGAMTFEVDEQKRDEGPEGVFFQESLVTSQTNPLTGRLRFSSHETPVQKTPGAIVADWTNNGALTLNAGSPAGSSAALDTAVLIDGVPALKCVCGNSGTYIADFTLTNPVSMSKFKSIQIPVIITCSESASGFGTSAAPFQIWLTAASGKSFRIKCEFAGIPPGKQHVFSVSRVLTNGSFVPATGLVLFSSGATGWADLDGAETITKVSVVVATGASSVGYPVWVGSIRTDARTVGRVSIRMDGEYSSQYSLVKPLLDKYGFKASLALTTADVGGAGRMTLAQIAEMVGNGHEPIHHTYDSTKTNGYVNATDWPSSAVIAADLKNQWDYFRTQGWDRGIGKCVAGFAESFISTVNQARQKLVLAGLLAGGAECWTESTNLYAQQMSLGNGKVAPFMLRGAIQITSTNVAADLTNIIDQVEASGEWAIITIHRAVADDATPGSLEMKAGLIDTWMAYAAARQAAGGILVQPLGEVFDECFK